MGANVKNPADCIRELERHCEALANALEEIRTATWQPKVALPALKRSDMEVVSLLRMFPHRQIEQQAFDAPQCSLDSYDNRSKDFPDFDPEDGDEDCTFGR